MGAIKRLAEQMAEAKGMTFEEFMAYEGEEPNEPDYFFPDIEEMREQSYYWKSLK